MKRTAVKLFIVLAICGALFGGVFGYVAYQDQMKAEASASYVAPPVPVTTALAETRDWARTIAAVGTLEAVLGTDVSPEQAGLVDEVLFESGQQVLKGDPLLRLDSSVELAELRGAEAELERARLNLERAQALSKSKTISDSALEEADSLMKVRAAEVQRLNALIAKKTILAPFDGTLGMRLVSRGQYLDPGTAIVNIQNLSSMLINFSVSQRDLPHLSLGQRIEMTVDAYPGRIFVGEVAAVAPLIDLRSGMIQVQGRFQNPDGALRPGMFASLNVILPAQTEVVAVPRLALTYSLYGTTVFTVAQEADGALRARRVVVQTGEQRDGWVAVLEGIASGDEVVTTGQLRLNEGAQVLVANEESLTAPATLPLD